MTTEDTKRRNFTNRRVQAALDAGAADAGRVYHDEVRNRTGKARLEFAILMKTLRVDPVTGETKMSLKALSEITGIKIFRLSGAETGQSVLDETSMHKYLAAFGASPEEGVGKEIMAIHAGLLSVPRRL